MLNRRHALTLAALTAVTFALPAHAAETLPFTMSAFEAAQKAGKSILVEVHAPWCPTCKAQAPILSEIQKGAAYKNLLVLKVDFDSQKDELKRLNVQMQSTLITFKGSRETGRSVGDTKAETIAALVAKAL